MKGNGQTFCIHNKQDFDSGKFWGILQVLNRIWPKLLACFCPPTKCFWPLTNCWVQNQHHWERHSCSFLFAKLSNNIWKFESQTFFFCFDISIQCYIIFKTFVHLSALCECKRSTIICICICMYICICVYISAINYLQPAHLTIALTNPQCTEVESICNMSRKTL